MLRRSVSFAALLFLVLAAASAPAGLAITKEFNQTYPLQPGGSFELQNVNGTVDVQGWDRDTIEIHAVKTAKRKESDLDLVSIDIDGARGTSGHGERNAACVGNRESGRFANGERKY